MKSVDQGDVELIGCDKEFLFLLLRIVVCVLHQHFGATLENWLTPGEKMEKALKKEIFFNYPLCYDAPPEKGDFDQH